MIDLQFVARLLASYRRRIRLVAVVELQFHYVRVCFRLYFYAFLSASKSDFNEQLHSNK